MNRLWIFAILTGAAAWALARSGPSQSQSRSRSYSRPRFRRVVPVDEAAEKLKRAWADHHTVA